jgi:hypothetical protein
MTIKSAMAISRVIPKILSAFFKMQDLGRCMHKYIRKNDAKRWRVVNLLLNNGIEVESVD